MTTKINMRKLILNVVVFGLAPLAVACSSAVQTVANNSGCGPKGCGRPVAAAPQMCGINPCLQPIVIKQKPIFVTQPPLVVKQPTIRVKQPPVRVRNAPVIIEQPQVVVQPPQVQVEQPRIEIEKPQITIEKPQIMIRKAQPVCAPPACGTPVMIPTMQPAPQLAAPRAQLIYQKR